MTKESLTIKHILYERDELYLAKTKEIFDIYGTLLENCVIDITNTKDAIEWLTIDAVQGLEDYVRICGVSTPRIGSIIVVDGNDVEVNIQNANYFKQITKFIIPMQLVESKDKEKIVRYLKDISQIINSLDEAQVMEVLRSYSNFDDDISNTKSYNFHLDKLTKPKDILGFSTDNLSDEQMKTLKLFESLNSSGTKN